jgi:hypothetical protein
MATKRRCTTRLFFSRRLFSLLRCLLAISRQSHRKPPSEALSAYRLVSLHSSNKGRTMCNHDLWLPFVREAQKFRFDKETVFVEGGRAAGRRCVALHHDACVSSSLPPSKQLFLFSHSFEWYTWVQSVRFRAAITFFFVITVSFLPEPKSSRSFERLGTRLSDWAQFCSCLSSLSPLNESIDESTSCLAGGVDFRPHPLSFASSLSRSRSLHLSLSSSHSAKTTLEGNLKILYAFSWSSMHGQRRQCPLALHLSHLHLSCVITSCAV